MWEWLTPENLQNLREAGAFLVILALYILDRLRFQPAREKRHDDIVGEIIEQFRQERTEDRAHMERITGRLAEAIDKLSAKIEEIETRAGTITYSR